MPTPAGQFYDSLSEEYDDMVETGSRRKTASRFVESLRDRLGFESAVDAATGTGVYALALAAAGVETVGADLSAGMVEKARKHAAELGLDVAWAVAPMETLAAAVSKPVDLALCMGNSLPHLLTPEALHEALAGFAAVLRPGGHLAVQVLNYRQILEEGERIVDITRQGHNEYVRFYDFEPAAVVFNILSIRWDDGKAIHRLHSTRLKPYCLEDLAPLLPRHGLRLVDTFGGLDLSPFDPAASASLILLAQKECSY